MRRSGALTILFAFSLTTMVGWADADSVSAFGWGGNNYGQTTAPASATNAIGVCAGDNFSAALRADGRVVMWGDDSSGQITGVAHSDGQLHYPLVGMPEGMTNVVKVVAWGNSTVALRADGSVVTWGGNNPFLVTNAPSDLGFVIDVAVGGSFNESGWPLNDTPFVVAVERGGRSVGWGANSWGQCNFPKNLGKVIGVAVGYTHTVLVLGDGTVAAFGSNFGHEREVPTGLHNVIAVGAGNNYSLALRGDGTVTIWGDNFGVTGANWAGGLSNVVKIACGPDHVLALKGDGTVAGLGNNNYGEVTLPSGVSGVLGIAIGVHHSLAMLAPPAADVPALLGINVYPGFLISGTPGAAYRIEYTKDLGQGAVWQTLTNVVLVEGVQRFLDWTAPGDTRRFYRAVKP